MARDVFDSEARRQIGERLRAIRGEATQRKFADEIGVGRVALSNYEGGRRLPGQKILQRYAEAGKTTVAFLLTGIPAATQIDWYEKRFRSYLEMCAKAEVIPKSSVSDDEMAILKLLRAINQRKALRFIAGILNSYDRQRPDFKNRYATRSADHLRRLVEAKQFPASGFDLEALVEGFDLYRRAVDD